MTKSIDNWRTVPVEPTQKMCDKGGAAIWQHETAEAVWAAMLAAAPQPPAGGWQPIVKKRLRDWPASESEYIQRNESLKAHIGTQTLEDLIAYVCAPLPAPPAAAAEQTPAPPSVPPASAEVPMPEGKLWSVLRGAVSDGSWVESHNGTMAHEHVSALLDAKAAARTEQLLPVVEAYAAAREQAAVERVRGGLERAVEWWLRDGQHQHIGAPEWVFAARTELG